MLARGTISRRSAQWLKSSSVPLCTTRTYAAATSSPFQYQISDSNGVKLVSKDTGSPTSSLAIVVKAGSRYETAPGVAHGLEHYAFKNTFKRSALYITREVEMLGGVLETSLSRENIVYKARFLRDDLPYFTELMTDIVVNTKYSDYELVERVGPTLAAEVESAYSDPSYVALEAAHGVAFHHGLGLDKMAVVRRYLTSQGIKDYAGQAYKKGAIAIVGSGVSHSQLQTWSNMFTSEIQEGTGLTSGGSKYHGGESRNWSPHGNSMVIAFPGSNGGAKESPEYTVLSYLLGGEPTIKWSPGNSLLNKAVAKFPGVKAHAKHLKYSDTGLLYVGVSGSAKGIKDAGASIVDAIKQAGNVKQEDVKKAIMNARFDIITAAEENALSMEAVGQSVIASGKVPQVEETIKALEGVTVDSIKKAASSLLGGKASVGTVGDLHILPYADEIGLKV